MRVYARGNALTVACYKVMTLLLLLLMPQIASRAAGVLLRLLGLAFFPLFLLLGYCESLLSRTEAMIAWVTPCLRFPLGRMIDSHRDHRLLSYHG